MYSVACYIAFFHRKILHVLIWRVNLIRFRLLQANEGRVQVTAVFLLLEVISLKIPYFTMTKGLWKTF